MSRTPIREIEQARGRRALSGLVLAGIAIVLLFAVVGVVSAGNYVAGQLSGSKSPVPKHTQPPATPLALQDIARAQAQATAIVKNAQAAGHSIVASAATRAHRQAAAIVARARQRASSVVAAAAASAPTATPAPAPVVAAPTAVSSGAPSSGATSSPSTSAGSATSPSTSASSGTVQTGGAASAATPDLSGVPASWRVVGYNATFGSGPGSAGSITVTNRGVKSYSGVTTVVYAGGGSASASFSGLAPGQTEVLPLDGPTYPGGGYHIVVNVG